MNKLIEGFYITVFFILPTLTLGCATPHHYPPIKNVSVPDKKVTSTFEGEETTSETNVVKGGLGYSFDLSYKDLNLSEYQVPVEIRKFGQVKKVDVKEFFPIVKLRFTPITGKLIFIEGLKVYEGVKSSNPRFPCYEDLQILKNSIETKYPSLKKYLPFVAKYNKDTLGYGYAPRIETKTSYTSPRGRYIEIQCLKSEQLSTLHIKYEDYDIRKILIPEHDTFVKQKEKEILDQKGIDLDKL